MDYKKEYEQAIERAKGIYYETIVPTPTAKGTCEYIFPELRENEDEKLREQVVYAINQLHVCECTKNKLLAWLEKQGEMKPQSNSALEVWKDMRLEVYQQASGNRHEPNYSDNSTKMFSLTDIDEIFEKVAEKQGERKQNVTDIISDLENYFATTTKEQQEKDWEEIKKWEEKHFNHNKNIEQNPTDKAEPKFKVGDTIRGKYDNREFTIKAIDLDRGFYTYTQEGCGNDIDYADVVFELKVEPKFKVGDWIISSQGTLRHIVTVDKTGYETDKGWLTHDDYEKIFHLWTIKDAKDGDVLYHKSPLTGIEYIVMSRGINSFGNVDSYFRYNSEDGFGIYIPSIFNAKVDDIKPATKEQRDLLFQEMKEAGYEWDAEKKELKKIEQKSIDKTKPKFKVGDVIRAKGGAAKYTIRSVTNTTYYTDGWSYDIESCEEEYELVEQNPTWSEEDEKMLKSVISSIRISRSSCEEDDDVRDLFDNEIDWLKSLKERYTWKPSNEQMKQLGWVAVQNKDNMIGKELMPLYQDLKKLKGE